MKYTIGIDLGTSSLKGIILSREGEVVLSASSEYEIHTPQSGYSEQNPQDWVEAFDIVMDKLFSNYSDLKGNVDGISFSGQMHSLVVLDSDNEVIRPAILWNDVRTSKQSDLINRNLNQEIIKITKNRSLEGFTLPKLMWLRENEPSNYKKINSILLPKDYLRYILTGNKHIDLSDAAGTLLLDLEGECWSEDLCEEYGVDINALPPLIKSAGFTGILTGLYSQKYGEIKVFAGGADNACAALGAGIINSERSMVSIGTSGVLLSAEEDMKNYKGLLHFFNHCSDNYYYSMGVTLSAGLSLSWIRGIIDPDLTYSELLKDISMAPIGADGLIFNPYLMGERTPHFDASARGSFVGLDVIHTKDHILRSVVEGITFSLKNSLDLINGTRPERIKEIVSVGGGAKNIEWLQIQADIFDTPIRTLTVEEGPSLGAAMLAALGANWFRDINECVDCCVKVNELIYPIKENVLEYEEFYRIYNHVYSSLVEVNHLLSEKKKR